MSESSLISIKPRGFAGLISNLMLPLNEKSQFKEKFKATNKKFLINATNLNHAALVIIKNGSIIVHSIPNKPKSNLKKKITNWDGFISMDSQIFISLAMNKISLLGLALKILTGKVKMKGILKLFKLLKIFDILKE
ncbi:MAG: hypothetical protein ACTSR8_03325 [Promethearchaeota archaeon]